MNARIDFENDPAAWIATAICVAGILFAVYGHLTHLRHPAMRAAFTYWLPVRLSFRIVALLLLAAMAWRPTVLSTTVGGPRQPVTLLVDDSVSMSTVDTDRSPGEALRIAVALGEISPTVRDRPAGRLLAELTALNTSLQTLTDAQRQRTTADVLGSAYLSKDSTPAAAAIEQAKSAVRLADSDISTRVFQKRLSDLSSRVDEREAPPIDALRSVINDLNRLENEADNALARDQPACRAAAASIFGQTRFELARTAAQRLSARQDVFGGIHPRTLSGPALETARAGQPVGSISLALRRIIGTDTGAGSMLLISDGRSTDNWGVASSALGGTEVAVDTISVAARGPTSLVRVVGMDVDREAFVNEKLRIRVRLQQRGGGAREADVTLSDGRQSQQRHVTLNSGDNEAIFAWPVTSSTRLHLTARASLSDTGRAASGVAAAEIRVVDRRIRVLWIGDAEAKKIRAIQQALQSQPWIRLSTVAVKGLTLDVPREQLRTSDVIVCAGLPGAAAGVLQAAALREAVEIDGKSLLILPDPSTAADLFSLPESLRALLPFRRPIAMSRTIVPGVFAATQSSARAIAIPTPDAQEVGVVDRDVSYDAVVRDWLVRPPVARPRDLGPLRPGARALIVDRETRFPMLVESVSRAGRIFTLTASDVYDWKIDQNMFWTSLVRSLYEKPYAESSSHLALDVDAGPILAGEKITIRGRVLDETRAPVSVRLFPDSADEAVEDETLEVRETLAGSNRYLATFIPEAPGTYVVEFAQGARTLSTRVTVVAADPQGEDTTPDPGLLRRIAETAGGTAFNLDELPQLPAYLDSRRKVRVVTTLNPIWSSGFMFACLVGCLGCDWAIRKHVGLL